MEKAQNGAAWWQKWAPVMAGIVVTGGAVIAFFVQLGSMQTSIDGFRSGSAQTERRISELEGQVQQIRERQSDNCQQFAKVETQFGTVETVMNETRVDDLRTRGLIWPKIFEQGYPPTFYEIKIPHDVEPCRQ